MWSLFKGRWGKLAVAAACVVGVLYIAHTVWSTLAPFVLAMIAAYIVSPAVDFLHRRTRVPRALLVAVFVTVLSLAVLGAIALGISYLVRTVEHVVPRAQQVLMPEGETRNFGERVKETLQSIPNEIRVQIELAVEQLPATIRNHFREISASLLVGFGAVFTTLLGLVVSTFRIVLFFVVTG